MKVVLSAEAEGDLERIGDHIAADNPVRALSFIRELRQRCEQIGDAPHAFALLPRHAHSGVRRRVHGNYLIFYTVGETAVYIIHVLHGAMDYEALLFPSP